MTRRDRGRTPAAGDAARAPAPAEAPASPSAAGGASTPMPAPAAARAAALDPTRAELSVTGTTDFSGELRGKGSLTLFLSDAARARVAVDYRRPDRLLVSVESEAGIRLSADDTLVLSGGLRRDMLDREIAGHVKAELKLGRDLAAQIEQEFGASGPATTVAVKLRI